MRHSFPRLLASVVCAVAFASCSDAGGSNGGGEGDGVVISFVKRGEGRIVSLPEGIDCGETCSAAFRRQEPVILNFQTDDDWNHVRISPECEGFELTQESRVCTVQFGLRAMSRTFGRPGEGHSGTAISRHPAGGWLVAGRIVSTPGESAKSAPSLSRLDEAGVPFWSKVLGEETSGGQATSLVATDDGFIVAGVFERNFWLAKVDLEGEIQWQKHYERAERFENLSFALPAPDGGFLLGGDSTSSGTFFGLHPRLLRVDAQGEIVWQKQFETVGNVDIETFSAAAPSKGGGYLLAGAVGSLMESTRARLVKITDEGDVEWSKTFAGSAGTENFRDVLAVEDGFVAVGNTSSWGAGGNDALVVKVDAAGEIVWQHAHGGPRNDGATRIVPAVGGFLVLGWTQSFGATGTDAWVMYLGTGGQIAWEVAIGGRGDDELLDAFVMTAEEEPVTLWNSVVAVGTSESFNNGDGDLWLVRTRNQGEVSFPERRKTDAKTTSTSLAIAAGTAMELERNPENATATDVESASREVELQASQQAP